LVAVAGHKESPHNLQGQNFLPCAALEYVNVASVGRG